MDFAACSTLDPNAVLVLSYQCNSAKPASLLWLLAVNLETPLLFAVATLTAVLGLRVVVPSGKLAILALSLARKKLLGAVDQQSVRVKEQRKQSCLEQANSLCTLRCSSPPYQPDTSKVDTILVA